MINYILIALIVVVSALILPGCRSTSTVPTPDVNENNISNAQAAQGAQSSVLPSSCECTCPSCYGMPIFTDGELGCTPTIGADGMGSVSVHMALGETFSVWMGQEDLAFVSEGAYYSTGWALTTFSDQVRARTYFLGNATYIVGASQLTFASCADTCVFEPQGLEIKRILPRADVELGRTYTIKLLDQQGGKLRIKAGYNDHTHAWETIDRKPEYTLVGHGTAIQIRSTGSEWIVIGTYKSP